MNWSVVLRWHQEATAVLDTQLLCKAYGLPGASRRLRRAVTCSRTPLWSGHRWDMTKTCQIPTLNCSAHTALPASEADFWGYRTSCRAETDFCWENHPEAEISWVLQRVVRDLLWGIHPRAACKAGISGIWSQACPDRARQSRGLAASGKCLHMELSEKNRKVLLLQTTQ